VSNNISTARGFAAVTPSNTVDIPEFRALYIGVAGDVKVLAPGATAGVVFKAVPVGVLLVQGVRVFATGTAATDIVALY
jgi:hypothetical protein